MDVLKGYLVPPPRSGYTGWRQVDDLHGGGGRGGVAEPQHSQEMQTSHHQDEGCCGSRIQGDCSVPDSPTKCDSGFGVGSRDMLVIVNATNLVVMSLSPDL